MNETNEVTRVTRMMRCVCGKELEGHVCSLTHKERMMRYADYCVKNNLKFICGIVKVTPFTHSLSGCLHCGTVLEKEIFGDSYYAQIISTSEKYYKLYAHVCDGCWKKLRYKYNRLYYCFVNMETPEICYETKPLRVLLVREIYNQHKVPRDIRNLINSLLSCNCLQKFRK